MKHRFLFICGEIEYSSFHQYFHIEHDAVFHDDIFCYIYDALAWVSSIQISFPSKKKTYEFYQYGINIIDNI
jgi:hypothetical protein